MGVVHFVPLMAQVAETHIDNLAGNIAMLRKFGSRVIHGCRFQICNQILHIDNTFADIRCPICNQLINKLTPHRIPKIQKFSPKLMLTRYALYICIFEFPCWISTDYLVNKWHN